MIPNLQEFTAGEFTLVDTATITDAVERGRVMQAGRQNLVDLIAKTRDTRICSGQTFLLAEEDGLRVFLARNPRATPVEIQAFRDTFDPGFDDSECDPRLDSKAFAIYQGRARDLLGAFFLYNMRTISDGRSVIEATAYPAPAFPFVNGADWSSTVATILRRLLQDIDTVDGRTLQLTAIDFPTRIGHAWAGEPWAERFVTDFAGEGFEKDVDEGGTLKRFRRRLAR